ncbi:MAG TPA: hypothetical protein VFK19_07055 [Sphingomicrobium sp.]|nr:hypothetical protein [Sphingomicrobium sp.]
MLGFPMFTVMSLALAGQPATVPKLSRAQVIQLFTAGGFTFAGGSLTNRCGQHASPRVQFIDLNGDGVMDAHIADVAPGCYGKPGAYYALLQRGADGSWRALIKEDAIASFPGTRTGAWDDVLVKSGNGACPGTRHFANGGYASGCTRQASAAVSAAPAAPSTPADQEPRDPAADKASVAALSAANRTAIFKAAGATRLGPGKWRMCTDNPKDDPATIESARDVNGDGRPDAFVTEGGTFCYGNTGTAYAFVSKQADGRWKLMNTDVAIPILLKHRGAGGYPDIVNGGPGMCFAVLRWNGTEFKVVGGNDGAGHSCRLP